MEITVEQLAALVAAEVAKVHARAEPQPAPTPPPVVMQTSLARYMPDPNEWTVMFRRFATIEFAGQLIAYQRGQSAGFPSHIARRIIASGAGVRIGAESG